MEVFVLFVFRIVVQGIGGANTGNHIFSLCIDKPFTIELVFACGGITGKGHAGCGMITHIAEYHGLHVNGGTPIVGNTFYASVRDGFFSVPAFENGFDTTFQLSLGIVGKFGSQYFFHPYFKCIG